LPRKGPAEPVGARARTMLDLPTTMKRALNHHAHGQLSEAEAIYREILAQIPSQFDALHNLGVLSLQRGDHQAALDFFRRSLAINPRSVPLHLNIGNVLRALKRPEEAIASYDRALSLKADYAEAYNNRATVLRDLKRYEEALASAERAIAIKPNYMEAHLNRAHALTHLNRPEDAIASFRETSKYGGDQEQLRYYIAALGAESPPAASPRSYIESLFNEYAVRFDQSLSSLKYGIPELLFNAIVAERPDGDRDVADLGCGTGLCGPLIRPIARTLVGVDLSTGMLQKATERAVYDRLINADLTEFLAANAAAFDLIIAADVLIYIGDLEATFAATRAALKPGGQFAFSVEAHEGEDFVLRPSRRYAHSLPYLRQLADRCGFVERKTIPVVVRQEEGKDVAGFMAIFDLR
jgi:predicted TPR repeat methyltransferase